jgi:predicted phosphate transport protein (TIGR00153 family)
MINSEVEMRNNKRKLEDIKEDFLKEFTHGIKTLNRLVNDFLEGKLDKGELQEIINSEKRCDRLKEEYIEQLFKKKRALPFIVEDRYKMILKLDAVIDNIEIVARYLRIYPFTMIEEINKDFSTLNKLLLDTVITLIECSKLIEADFNQARDKTMEIEDLRREAFNLKFELLEHLFELEKEKDPKKILLTSELISEMYSVIGRSEELADYLEGLIIKYPNK